MAFALQFAPAYRIATKQETMGRVARKGLDPRLIKKTCRVSVNGLAMDLNKNDIVYVHELTDDVIAIQKAGSFFLVEELVEC